MRDYNYNLDLTPVALDYQYFTCLKVTLGNNWAARPLAGNFDDGGDYVMQGADTDFISIFGNKLRELLSQSGTKRAEHFKSLQIKQYVQEQLIQAYSGSNSARPLAAYAEIEKLIVAHESPKGITIEDLKDAMYSSRFAITRRYSSTCVSYELDINGLKTLADILEVLSLSGLQEVNVIVNKIRAVCA